MLDLEESSPAISGTNTVASAPNPRGGLRWVEVKPLLEAGRIVLVDARAKTAFGDENRWQEMLKGLPYDRLIEPGEIGRTAAFLASPACGYVGGTVLDVDGGGMFKG